MIVVQLVRSEPGPVSSSAAKASTTATAPAPEVRGGRIRTPSEPAFPSPPRGALVLSRQAGRYALGVALAPDGAKTLARVSVISAAGPGAAGLTVTVAGAKTEACARGCYQTDLASMPSGSVTVGIGRATYSLAVPATTSGGAAIVAKAETVWRGLKTLVWHETFSGGPGTTIHVIYKAVAPHDLEYTIDAGSQARLIGDNRWDRPSGSAAWIPSSQDPPVDQPQPFWVHADDVRVIGKVSVGGRPAWRVTFFDPATPGWFTATIDRATYRTVALQMIAASHFMHDRYGPFDEPFTVDPP